MRVDQGVGGFKKVTLTKDEVDCLSKGFDVNSVDVNITTEDQPSLKPNNQKTWFRHPEDRNYTTLGSLGQGMTPNDLEIMIHFYVSPAQHPRQGAVDHTCERLEELGVLKFTGNNTKWAITQKGKAWMRCILDTPFPKNVWLDDKGHTIDINED